MRLLGGILIALAIYCGLDPFNHRSTSGFPNFKSYKVDLPNWANVPTNKDPLNLLQKSDIKFVGQVQGPESVAFDPLGRGPYTGVADGRVMFWNGLTWVDFAYTSSNRSGQCDPQPSHMGYLKNEHICGRPLGLRFHKKTGDLYIADAYFGLMKVGAEGGLATSLTTEAEGVPLSFTNDLDIDDQGNVYFTDSSSNYQRRDFLQLVFSAEETGRVLKYDLVTKETTVLLRNLQFPNGITLSKDGSFFIFCEGSIGRLTRYWLKGEKAGTSDIFAILPGSPDNVRTNKDGDFWVALHCRRRSPNYWLSTRPKLRDLLLKLPIKAKYQFMLTRYWLKGEKAGTSDIFAILPGSPDNVRTNKDGDFWVALHCRRRSPNYWLSTRPKLRDLLLKLPIKAKYQFMFFISGIPHGIVVKYSREGEILQVLEDRPGKVVKAVSDVMEKDGKLWIGSVLMPFIAVYDLGSTS